MNVFLVQHRDTSTIIFSSALALRFMNGWHPPLEGHFRNSRMSKPPCYADVSEVRQDKLPRSARRVCQEDALPCFSFHTLLKSWTHVPPQINNFNLDSFWTINDLPDTPTPPYSRETAMKRERVHGLSRPSCTAPQHPPTRTQSTVKSHLKLHLHSD